MSQFHPRDLAMSECSDRIMNELQQYSTFHTLLLDDLRELLEERLDAENSRWVHAIVDQLCTNLQREFALEDQAGYLEEVLERFPNWLQRVERLRRNRLGLISDLKQLQGKLNNPPDQMPIANSLRDEFRSWADRLADHKRQENILLLDAVNLDVGEGE